MATARRSSGYWLDGIPADAVAAIDRIHREVSGPPPMRNNGSWGSGWWVRRSPTTRTPTEVTLVHRTGGRVDEWPILCDGRLVA